jgi:hypothetical protein
MLAFLDTSLDSLLLPLSLSALCMLVVRMSASACANAARSRDAQLIASASQLDANRSLDS